MDRRYKKYSFVLLLTLMAMISACSVNNKSIPDPGNINVDTTGALGTFYLNVTGDSSYLLTVVAVDTIVQDSFAVAGADFTRRDEVVFTTGQAVPGTYYTEQSPPGITGAVFLYRKRLSTGYRNYAMFHGKVVISSVDLATKVVRGTIDVNNQYVTSADHVYYLKGNFIMKYNN
ncbi:MAG: hypothetical protein JWN78_1928 [Bacteroidota bacterium]|nr:hypothetical protein [Bacteroidota bacterium]